MASPYNEVKPTSLGKSRRKLAKKSNSSVSSRVDGRPGSLRSEEESTSNNSQSTEAPVSSSPPVTSTTPDAGQWPQALQEFVSNSFIRANSILTEYQKGEFNKQLQYLIERAFATGTLFTNNWNQQKIPILDNVPLALHVETINNIQPVQSIQSVQPTNTSYLPTKRLDYSSLNESRTSDFESKKRKKQRLERFETPPPKLSPSTSNSNSNTTTIVGRCQDLEKNYLRLTSEPDPSRVRPQAVLEKSVKFVLNKYSENKTYSYIINQFKSIRQDLTVQHLKNDFAIYVYELNAKISLENGDLGEFNQCQSQLKYLYYLKREKDSKLNNKFFRWEAELLVYRIIYMLITNNHSEMSKLKFSILHTYNNFEKTEKEQTIFEFIKIIFELHSDILLGNYHHFFKIIRNLKITEDLTLAITLVKNSLYEKNRLKALQTIVNSYKRISVDFLLKELNFEHLQQFAKFLSNNSLSNFLINDDKDFECTGSKATIHAIVNKPNFNKVDIKGQI
ncbi:uncharacterized protein RJT21DRAFT_19432 [Scheffersomyces amazonensis]|uniref:uncharacterized protein n=1 Tax=Scheffersomyces amazonensis TaxID=1078765 RepID=UPI00315D8DEA